MLVAPLQHLKYSQGHTANSFNLIIKLSTIKSYQHIHVFNEV